MLLRVLAAAVLAVAPRCGVLAAESQASSGVAAQAASSSVLASGLSSGSAAGLASYAGLSSVLRRKCQFITSHNDVYTVRHLHECIHLLKNYTQAAFDQRRESQEGNSKYKDSIIETGHRVKGLLARVRTMANVYQQENDIVADELSEQLSHISSFIQSFANDGEHHAAAAHHYHHHRRHRLSDRDLEDGLPDGQDAENNLVESEGDV